MLSPGIKYNGPSVRHLVIYPVRSSRPGDAEVKMTEPQHASRWAALAPADFNTLFPDDSTCLDFLKEQKYPSGLAPCAKCGRARRHHRVRGRRAYACAHCGRMISPMSGTIFQNSSTGLRTWFYAMYRAASAQPPISARQLQRETGVTYKTAWRMLTRIRGLMAQSAALENDEASVRIASAMQEGNEVPADMKLLRLFQGPRRTAETSKRAAGEWQLPNRTHHPTPH
jgi:transposase-like protein